MAANNPLARATEAATRAYEFRNSFAFDAAAFLRQVARHLAELADEASDAVDVGEAMLADDSLTPGQREMLEAIVASDRKIRDELSAYRPD